MLEAEHDWFFKEGWVFDGLDLFQFFNWKLLIHTEEVQN